MHSIDPLLLLIGDHLAIPELNTVLRSAVQHVVVIVEAEHGGRVAEAVRLPVRRRELVQEPAGVQIMNADLFEVVYDRLEQKAIGHVHLVLDEGVHVSRTVRRSAACLGVHREVHVRVAQFLLLERPHGGLRIAALAYDQIGLLRVVLHAADRLAGRIVLADQLHRLFGPANVVEMNVAGRIAGEQALGIQRRPQDSGHVVRLALDRRFRCDRLHRVAGADVDETNAGVSQRDRDQIDVV